MNGPTPPARSDIKDSVGVAVEPAPRAVPRSLRQVGFTSALAGTPSRRSRPSRSNRDVPGNGSRTSAVGRLSRASCRAPRRRVGLARGRTVVVRIWPLIVRFRTPIGLRDDQFHPQLTRASHRITARWWRRPMGYQRPMGDVGFRRAAAVLSLCFCGWDYIPSPGSLCPTRRSVGTPSLAPWVAAARSTWTWRAWARRNSMNCTARPIGRDSMRVRSARAMSAYCRHRCARAGALFAPLCALAEAASRRP